MAKIQNNNAGTKKWFSAQIEIKKAQEKSKKAFKK